MRSNAILSVLCLLFFIITAFKYSSEPKIYMWDASPPVRGKWRSSWEMQPKVDTRNVCKGYPYNYSSKVEVETMTVMWVYNKRYNVPIASIEEINNFCYGVVYSNG